APDDIRDVKKMVSLFGWNAYLFGRILKRNVRQQYIYFFIQLVLLHPIERFAHGHFKIFCNNRFQQIINSRKLKSLDRILLIGCGENKTEITVCNRRKHIKPGFVMQMYIKKHDVWMQRIDTSCG